MTQPQVRPLPKSPCSGRQPETPDVGEALDVLDLALVPAEGGQGETTAAFGVARVGRDLAETYGGRVAGATAIIAIDSLTGLLYQAIPERVDSVPLVPVLRSPAELEAMDAVTSALETCFAVDLGEHLALPPSAGHFTVLLWLDELCSQPKVCELPLNLERSVLPVEPNLNAAALGFQADGELPAPPAGELSLVASPTSGELSDVFIDARLDLESLSEDDDELVTLTGMLRGQLDRDVIWGTWRATTGHLRSTGGRLRIKPFGARQVAARPQRWFAGLVAGSAARVILAHDPV